MPKLLVANRGEIAIRIFKTARKKGWICVAIYSEADAQSMHLQYADEAYCIGPAPSNQSYLHIDAIIALAIKVKADFIHPGYGFLSENAEFAQAVRNAGIRFVGPDAEAMQHLGNKISAKITAHSLGIPLVPGNHTSISNSEEAFKIAEAIGFPVIIKAAAGGGGKGMRVIHLPEQLKEGIVLARSEALASFGNDDIFIERFIQSPRHIEIQVVGDMHGTVLFLPPRECSLQRRHQKIMEESPANEVSTELIGKMSEDAVRLAKSCDYYSTGTVEFIVEGDHYYFLEMNTRLQVEHTVTEMITGLDLVDMQLEVANGRPFALSQKDIISNGHAIQWRINAEDPFNNFAPSSGNIQNFRPPAMDHLRLDSGYTSGKEIPVYYDSLIAKLIAWAPDRLQCISALRSALNAFIIEGVMTTIPFGIQVLDQPAIKAGHYSVDFLDKNLPHILDNSTNTLHSKAAAILALHLYNKTTSRVIIPKT
jgi:acetyl-CoA carboxylase biotin carboxylase subunit